MPGVVPRCSSDVNGNIRAHCATPIAAPASVLLNPNLVETRLFHATRAGDDASREVYADWLEEHGDPARADFLRLLQQRIDVDDPRYDRWLRKLHALREKIDPAWLAHVDPNPVLPFEVELAAHYASLSAPPPAPVETPKPQPAPPRVRSKPRRYEWSRTVDVPAVVVDTSVPAWIRVGSTLAGSVILLAIALYWIVS